MLVLTRHLGEKIYIGDDVCITVMGIDRGRVRLGVDAPRSVPVHRSEVAPRAKAEGEPRPEEGESE